jgi:stearoyl-CoA 9-desaturase NADPH oxidoreductase
LEGLERVGLNPTFGCRIGICKSCQCIKRSGVVKNHRTGELSDAPNEWIQLCVSSALSPLELAL